ncbi:tRNA (adenosine(37)-N6)-dimethylallyltransferase MiaA [Salicola sp. Rm-C-2C1-2]|uniref:tRNA (adenosine(37)-N6)-dimethylallyltransferase MiaA n=1 Tax=Salicola sp. Rm-C-2C1-2 TaxID=3141321 RepID=UPI0032E4A3FE
MGPTASGKTDLAMELRERLDGELISVDSALVYRDMDIGTAKPDAATLRRAPHHLIDIRDPAEPYSAAEFANDAKDLTERIRGAGRVPILVGGTMLYFNVLRQGMAAMPQADVAVRAELEQRFSTEGGEALYRELAAVDPVAAARVHPNNRQRLIRALEVYLVSGQPISAFWAQTGGDGSSGGLPEGTVSLALAPPQRRVLHERIERRFMMMLERGLLDEVRRLYARGDLSADLPSIRAVGYRQAWEYLNGETHYNGMIERALAATRQLAKRQLTWLRKWPGAHWLDSQGGDTVADALKIIDGGTTFPGIPESTPHDMKGTAPGDRSGGEQA